MRRSAGSRVCIVLSEEMMAAYAANRIAEAVRRFADNGIVLAGLIVNLRNNMADLSPIKRFADSICTQVIQVLPRDPLVCEAELFRKTIVDYSPESPVAQGIQNVVHHVLGLDSSTIPVPTPIPDAEVRDIMRGGDVPGEISVKPRENPASTITQWSQL